MPVPALIFFFIVEADRCAELGDYDQAMNALLNARCCRDMRGDTVAKRQIDECLDALYERHRANGGDFQAW